MVYVRMQAGYKSEFAGTKLTYVSFTLEIKAQVEPSS